MLERLRALRAKWSKMPNGVERDDVSALIEAYERVLNDMQFIEVKEGYMHETR